MPKKKPLRNNTSLFQAEQEFPGALNFINVTGLQKGERVLMLTDDLADPAPINVLTNIFSLWGAEIRVETLPRVLKPDFPPSIRSCVDDADVVILAASQSWYQAPTRRRAKHTDKKRVVECYGLHLDMLRTGALSADPEIVAAFTKEFCASFYPGADLTITTDRGTGITARIRGVYEETGLYRFPGSGGNLPAGEISLGIAENSLSGKIVFDISFDVLGRLDTHPLILLVEKGRVTSAEGRYKAAFEALAEKDRRMLHIAEIGIGTNCFSITGRSVLEDEKKLGTVHIGFGNDTYFGGSVKGAHFDGVFSYPTIAVSGTIVMDKGTLTDRPRK